jgi:hypothetical protein
MWEKHENWIVGKEVALNLIRPQTHIWVKRVIGILRYFVHTCFSLRKFSVNEVSDYFATFCGMS